MEKKLETLYDLCEIVSRELEECNEKVRKAGGKLSPGDIEYLDKLTHMLKSLKTTIAMMESEGEDGGYSNRGYMPNWGGYAYEGGNSYAGRMNAKRDSMGRYSRESRDYSRNRGNSYGGSGYSYAEDMEETKDEMRELAQKMPEEHRRKIERALDELR